MLKTYKYRLYPTEPQKQHFAQAFGCVRYIYNKALETRQLYYEATGKTLSVFDLNSSLLIEEKKKHDWLKIPNAQSLQSSIANMGTAFKNFFAKRADFPNFKKRSDKQSLQYPQRISVDFKSSKVQIPKAGKVFCVFDRKFEGQIKTCTVSKTPTNKYYISILVENDQELPTKPLIADQNSIGIDLGLTDFAIFSDGTKIENPRFLRNLLQRLKVLQKRASKKQKGSNNRKKANFKVAKLHEKITNQRQDFLHKTSTSIIRENQTIILEDLNVAGMKRNHCLALSISDVSWSKFVEYLKYKAEWYGNNIIQIGRFDPSSKKCSCCGHINQDLKRSDREWTCSICQAEHDRDINAAINIKEFGLQQIKQQTGTELPEELAEMPCSNADQ